MDKFISFGSKVVSALVLILRTVRIVKQIKKKD